MNLYNEALKIWVSRKIGSGKFWAEDILEIKFGEGDHGVCETCHDPYLSLDVLVERSGKKKWHQMDIEGYPMDQIIQECLEIYLTLAHRSELAVMK